MTQARVLTWVCSVLLVTVTANLAEGIGVNWGRQVVTMVVDNGFNKVKLSDFNSYVVGVFSGTGIEIMISIPNEELARFSNGIENARQWVKQNVNIKYVVVGNEPSSKRYNDTFSKPTLLALENIQKALNEAGVGDRIKATIPSNLGVYKSDTRGLSGGAFHEDIKELMVQIVHFLDHFSVDFGFFDGDASPATNNDIKDTSAVVEKFDFECSNSDSTSLGYELLCNKLEVYKMKRQNPKLGISQQNLSQGNRLFPVQIIDASERLDMVSGVTVVVALLLVLSTLF